VPYHWAVINILKDKRITIAIETFEIIHRKSPQSLHDLIDIKARSYNFENTAAVPRVRTTRYGMKSFRYNAAQICKKDAN
jgi:hypothetical protein